MDQVAHDLRIMVPVCPADPVGLEAAERLEDEPLGLETVEHRAWLCHQRPAGPAARAASRTTPRTILPRSLRGISPSLNNWDGTASALMRARHHSLIASSVDWASARMTMATATASPDTGSGRAEGAGLGDVGVALQQHVDLFGRHLDAAPVDLVLDAADEEEAAVGIDLADVAGPEPGTVKDFRRLVGHAVEAEHDRRRIEDDLARTDLADIAVLAEHAETSAPGLADEAVAGGGILERGAADPVGGFRHAVHVEDALRAGPAADLGPEFQRQRRRADMDAGEGLFRLAGHAHGDLPEGRHRTHEGDVLAVEQVAEAANFGDVRPGPDMQRAARRKRGQAVADEAVAEKRRQDIEGPGEVGAADGVDVQRQPRGERAQAVNDALGGAGRA